MSEIETIEIDVKKYPMRTLTAKDILPMTNIIKKFGVDEFKHILNSKEVREAIDENGSMDAKRLGIIVGFAIALDVASIVVNNLDKCGNDVYEFLGNVTELGKEEVEKIPLDEFGELIVDFVHKKELAGFFKVVLKLLK